MVSRKGKFFPEDINDLMTLPTWIREFCEFQVVLRDLISGREYQFPCGRWLATGRKTKTSVDLFPVKGKFDARSMKEGRLFLFLYLFYKNLCKPNLV